MTDQYINQRIIGIGIAHLGDFDGLPAAVLGVHQALVGRWLTTAATRTMCRPFRCSRRLGDDTVPLRSGAASEPLSKMLLDGHYYFVNNAHHMMLGADVRVRHLVVGLLKGDFCTNQRRFRPAILPRRPSPGSRASRRTQPMRITQR